MKELLGKHYPNPDHPRASCIRDHCWDCMEDEPIRGRVYIICFECSHLYETSRDLMLAHLDMIKELNTAVSPDHLGMYGPFEPPADAHQIWSCPLCSHDF